MKAQVLLTLLLVLILSVSVVESKTFFSFEPKEIETDCGKFSKSKAQKCCPATCEKCHTVEKRKKNLCHWLKVGKNGRREQCCSYFTICKKNKENKSICHNTKRTCKWSSKLVKTFKKSNCFWQPNGGGEQRKCCHWTVKCFGEKCFDLRKKCKWTGKIVTKALDHGCSWVTVGKNTRRQRCCEQSRRCVGKKCTIKNRKCQWRTLPIKLDWITKCKWVKKRKQ